MNKTNNALRALLHEMKANTLPSAAESSHVVIHKDLLSILEGLISSMDDISSVLPDGAERIARHDSFKEAAAFVNGINYVNDSAVHPRLIVKDDLGWAVYVYDEEG